MKGVDESATSQISKPVCSSYTHLPEEDIVSQDSPTQTDFEVIPPINLQLLTISKPFAPDLVNYILNLNLKIIKPNAKLTNLNMILTNNPKSLTNGISL